MPPQLPGGFDQTIPTMAITKARRLTFKKPFWPVKMFQVTPPAARGMSLAGSLHPRCNWESPPPFTLHPRHPCTWRGPARADQIGREPSIRAETRLKRCRSHRQRETTGTRPESEVGPGNAARREAEVGVLLGILQTRKVTRTGWAPSKSRKAHLSTRRRPRRARVECQRWDREAGKLSPVMTTGQLCRLHWLCLGRNMERHPSR